MRTRMSLVDIRAIVSELKKNIVGLRLANCYDINSKTYMLKFAKPDQKVFVMVESGVRIHSTQFLRDKSSVPSGFTLKLRKHLRTRRLEGVQQMGVDRVVDFIFGSGENCYHLIVEFYARGNVILTDHKYVILSLLRTHKHEESAVFAVGETYPTHSRKEFAPISAQRLVEVISEAARNEKTKNDNLKQVMTTALDYGPFTEHCILSAGIKPTTKISQILDISENSETIAKLVEAFKEADEFILESEKRHQTGYIFLKEKQDKSSNNNSSEQSSSQPADQVSLYEDFAPFPFKQFEGLKRIEFPTFGEAVDEFFSKIEDQRIEQAKALQETAATKKIDKIREDHKQRIAALKEQQDENLRKATLIEKNLEDVDQAILVINSAVAQQLNWDEIKRVVKEQKKIGNPIANIIHSLKLESNQITLLLNDSVDDGSEEDITRPAEKVDVDISLSAYANARAYYEAKKRSAQKAQKTEDMTGKALKAAEKKSKNALKQNQITAKITLMRKRFWFEKFNWFITSENYLVISGRDMQQNEMLVKKYMGKGDIYVHADIHGASSCIVKNPTGKPIPPMSMAQVGCYCVCRSAAWEAKVVTSAWWVYHDQVSKTAPTGEYLPTGSFMIRGKKNFLPPYPLVMGFGIMFRIDESCIPNHVHERRPRIDEDELEATQNKAQNGSASDEEEEELEKRGPRTQNQRNQNNDADEYAEEDMVEEEVAPKLPTASKSDDTETVLDVRKADKYGISLMAPIQPQEEEINNNNNNNNNNNDDDDDDYNAQQDRKGTGKKKLSAKERKILKKQQKQGSDQQQQKGDGAAQQPQQQQPSKKQQKQNENLSRGKRSKLKKIKKKYADQDEEERRLRMKLLGHKIEDKEEEEQEQQEQNEQGEEEGSSDDSAEQQQKQRQPKEDSDRTQQQQDGSNNDEEEQNGNTTANNSNQEVVDDDEEAQREKEEIRQIMEEENVPYLDEEERARLQLNDLDVLTGCPRPDDVLLFAIPMCGPYDALRNFKYKVKVIPGSEKRGKAVKQTMSMFLAEENVTQREKELLKSITDEELIYNMPSNVKIASSAKFAQKNGGGGKGGNKKSNKK